MSGSLSPPTSMPPPALESFDNFQLAIARLNDVKTPATRDLIHSIQRKLYGIDKRQWEAMKEVFVMVTIQAGVGRVERQWPWTRRMMNDLAGVIPSPSPSSIEELKGVVEDFKNAVLRKSLEDLYGATHAIPTSSCKEVECLKLSLFDLKQIDIDKLAAKDDDKGFFLDQIRRKMSWIIVHLREWEASGESDGAGDHLKNVIKEVALISNLCHLAIGEKWAAIWNHHASSCQVANVDGLARQQSLSHRKRFMPVRR